MEIIARLITKHYERLTMVHEVYEEVRRYTITTFTDETKKPQERQPREAKFIHFFPIILNLGRVLNVNIHKLGSNIGKFKTLASLLALHNSRHAY